MRQMVFVLGDSRTGTTSLHQWLSEQGFRSIHYFVSDAGLREPLHMHRRYNWERLRSFIKESGFDAFSDYPVRPFFRELAEEFQEAKFILSLRRDVSTWRRSMLNFFGEGNIDIEFLQAFYVAWNEEIRALFKETGQQFFEVCIDSERSIAGTELTEFLDLTEATPIPHLNASH